MKRFDGNKAHLRIVYSQEVDADDDLSIDTLTGNIIETISEMSVPSVRDDGLISEATPIVNRGEEVQLKPDFNGLDSAAETTKNNKVSNLLFNLLFCIDIILLLKLLLEMLSR